MIPTLIDRATPEDAGYWLKALAFVSFPVLEFEARDDAAREQPDPLASEPSSFFHAAGVPEQ